MGFLPRGFDVPAGPITDRLHLRPITIHDVVKDLDAVHSSRERLWSIFGEVWGWPDEELTYERDLIDLAWHQKEGELRRAFNFAVMSPDDARLLGCVYVDPPEKVGADADVCWWVREDEVATGLEPHLSEVVRAWLAESWPFATVRFPGIDITWAEWEELDDVD